MRKKEMKEEVIKDKKREVEKEEINEERGKRRKTRR